MKPRMISESRQSAPISSRLGALRGAPRGCSGGPGSAMEERSARSGSQLLPPPPPPPRPRAHWPRARRRRRAPHGAEPPARPRSILGGPRPLHLRSLRAARPRASAPPASADSAPSAPAASQIPRHAPPRTRVGRGRGPRSLCVLIPLPRTPLPGATAPRLTEGGGRAAELGSEKPQPTGGVSQALPPPPALPLLSSQSRSLRAWGPSPWRRVRSTVTLISPLCPVSPHTTPQPRSMDPKAHPPGPQSSAVGPLPRCAPLQNPDSTATRSLLCPGPGPPGPLQ